MSKYNVILCRPKEGGAVQMMLGTEPCLDDKGLTWQATFPNHGWVYLPRESFPELKGDEVCEAVLSVRKPSIFRRLLGRLLKIKSTPKKED